jgi:hypothetical protein
MIFLWKTSENTVLETVSGSNLFPFSDPKEKTKLLYC